MKFEVEFECNSTQDAIYALQEIMNQLEDGYSCGHLCGVDGSWSCSGEEMKDDEECRLVHVEWDLSDSVFETFEDEGIPREVWVPVSVDEDEIADWLSDTYGWCVNSFEIDN
jgi:hypothetical protein